jgi:hypothetical protein
MLKRYFVTTLEEITTHRETHRKYVAGQAATLAKRPNFPPSGVTRPARSPPSIKRPDSRAMRAGPITFAVEVRHPSNATMTAGDNTEPTSVRRSSFVTPLKTPFPPRQVRLDGNRSCVKHEHPENAHSAIVVTLDGISNCVKPEHLEKADAPIVVTLDGICSCVNPEHSEKAHSPIVVTPDGISS